MLNSPERGTGSVVHSFCKAESEQWYFWASQRRYQSLPEPPSALFSMCKLSWPRVESLLCPTGAEARQEQSCPWAQVRHTGDFQEWLMRNPALAWRCHSPRQWFVPLVCCSLGTQGSNRGGCPVPFRAVRIPKFALRWLNLSWGCYILHNKLEKYKSSFISLQ